MGSINVLLTKPLVTLIALSFDHQNHSKWHKWCHVRYNLPLFGDWWQHNQSKHKIFKNWQIEPLTLACMLTIIQWRFGLSLKPWSPSVPPPICYSSLICWLDPIGIFPLWNILFFLGNISPPLLGTCLALIHISPPLESNHLKGLAPKMSCKTI